MLWSSAYFINSVESSWKGNSQKVVTYFCYYSGFFQDQNNLHTGFLFKLHLSNLFTNIVRVLVPLLGFNTLEKHQISLIVPYNHSCFQTFSKISLGLLYPRQKYSHTDYVTHSQPLHPNSQPSYTLSRTYFDHLPSTVSKKPKHYPPPQLTHHHHPSNPLPFIKIMHLHLDSRSPWNTCGNEATGQTAKRAISYPKITQPLQSPSPDLKKYYH